MSTIGDFFLCLHCGRQFRWKPELAGRQGKCSCGKTVSVPVNMEPEDDGGVYALADEEPASVIPVGVIVPPLPPQPAAISYQPVVPAGVSPLHLPTDVYIPSAVFISAIVFISLQVGFRPRFMIVLIGLWVVIAITALPGIAAFMLYGVFSSRRLSIPIASFCLAAFKILTVVIVADSVFFGLLVYLQFTHARLDLGGIFLTFIMFLICIGGTVGISSLVFFHRKEDRFRAASFPVSALAWILHFLLALMLYSILTGFASRRNARLAAARPVTTPVFIAGSAPSSIATIVTSNDRQIMQAASQGMLVMEAHQWKNMHANKNPELDTLIDDLYSAGAVKVYIDMRVGGFSHPGFAYLQLPANLADRTKCLSIYRTYASWLGLPAPGPSTSPAPMFTQLQLRL